mgnify:CR=1 FL=1
MIKREIERTTSSKSEIDGISYKDLFRLAAEKEIIDNPEAWFVYCENRNITSYTYDSCKASEIFRSAVEFFGDDQKLLIKLKELNN